MVFRIGSRPLSHEAPQRFGKNLDCDDAAYLVVGDAHYRPPHRLQRVRSARVPYPHQLAGMLFVALVLDVDAVLGPAEVAPEMRSPGHLARVAGSLHAIVHDGQPEPEASVHPRQAQHQSKLSFAHRRRPVSNVPQSGRDPSAAGKTGIVAAEKGKRANGRERAGAF